MPINHIVYSNCTAVTHINELYCCMQITNVNGSHVPVVIWTVISMTVPQSMVKISRFHLQIPEALCYKWTCVCIVIYGDPCSVTSKSKLRHSVPYLQQAMTVCWLQRPCDEESELEGVSDCFRVSAEPEEDRDWNRAHLCLLRTQYRTCPAVSMCWLHQRWPAWSLSAACFPTTPCTWSAEHTWPRSGWCRERWKTSSTVTLENQRATFVTASS